MGSKRPIRHVPPVPTPRYAPGEPKDFFVVVDYLGHSLVNPTTGDCLAKRQHWYTVRCTHDGCSNTETINQSQLNARKMCLQCADVFKIERISRARLKAEAEKSAKERPVGRPQKLPEPTIPAHLDFARMKLK